MKRIPLLLVAVSGALMLMAGSAFAGATRMAASPANSALPTVSGTAQTGHTLNASNGTWSGTAPIAYTYQWQRCNSSGSSCGSIGSATNQNYVASSGDIGHTIRVEVTATNADGKSQALSTATAQIAPTGNAPANTRQPNPAGTAEDGKTVTVDNGTWSGLQPITYSYQWESCTTVNSCTDLAGMTSSSLVVGPSLVGTLLRASVTATNSIGKTSALSNATAVVVAKPTAPVNTTRPAISGLATVGQRLSASTGTWTGVTAAYRYQWSRCNANGTSCSGVYGATGTSYGLGQADFGLSIRVSVIATNTIGSTTAISNSSAIKARILQIHTFRSVLRAGQEVSIPNGPMARAVGHFTAKVTGNTLRWTLTFSHLSGRPTVARLNRGIRGTNGAAFKSLCRSCRSPNHGTLTLTASQLAAMLRGGSYVNVHTSKNTRGEIRGQITRVS